MKTASYTAALEKRVNTKRNKLSKALVELGVAASKWRAADSKQHELAQIMAGTAAKVARSRNNATRLRHKLTVSQTFGTPDSAKMLSRSLLAEEKNLNVLRAELNRVRKSFDTNKAKTRVFKDIVSAKQKRHNELKKELKLLTSELSEIQHAERVVKRRQQIVEVKKKAKTAKASVKKAVLKLKRGTGGKKK